MLQNGAQLSEVYAFALDKFWADRHNALTVPAPYALTMTAPPPAK